MAYSNSLIVIRQKTATLLCRRSILEIACRRMCKAPSTRSWLPPSWSTDGTRPCQERALIQHIWLSMSRSFPAS